jgi:hypothetical protein
MNKKEKINDISFYIKQNFARISKRTIARKTKEKSKSKDKKVQECEHKLE